jgi:hypothetical protein
MTNVPSEPTRRPYTTPVLRDFGVLTQLTQGSAGGKKDNKGNTVTNPDRT